MERIILSEYGKQTAPGHMMHSALAAAEAD